MPKKNFYCCNSFVLFFQVFDSYELSFKAGEVKLDTFFYEEGNIMWNGETGAKTVKKTQACTKCCQNSGKSQVYIK